MYTEAKKSVQSETTINTKSDDIYNKIRMSLYRKKQQQPWTEQDYQSSNMYKPDYRNNVLNTIVCRRILEEVKKKNISDYNYEESRYVDRNSINEFGAIVKTSTFENLSKKLNTSTNKVREKSIYSTINKRIRTRVVQNTPNDNFDAQAMIARLKGINLGKNIKFDDAVKKLQLSIPRVSLQEKPIQSNSGTLEDEEILVGSKIIRPDILNSLRELLNSGKLNKSHLDGSSNVVVNGYNHLYVEDLSDIGEIGDEYSSVDDYLDKKARKEKDDLDEEEELYQKNDKERESVWQIKKEALLKASGYLYSFFLSGKDKTKSAWKFTSEQELGTKIKRFYNSGTTKIGEAYDYTEGARNKAKDLGIKGLGLSGKLADRGVYYGKKLAVEGGSIGVDLLKKSGSLSVKGLSKVPSLASSLLSKTSNATTWSYNLVTSTYDSIQGTVFEKIAEYRVQREALLQQQKLRRYLERQEEEQREKERKEKADRLRRQQQEEFRKKQAQIEKKKREYEKQLQEDLRKEEKKEEKEKINIQKRLEIDKLELDEKLRQQERKNQLEIDLENERLQEEQKRVQNERERIEREKIERLQLEKEIKTKKAETNKYTRRREQNGRLITQEEWINEGIRTRTGGSYKKDDMSRRRIYTSS